MTSEAQPIEIIPQHTIALAHRIAAADGSSRHEVLTMPRDAWSSLCRISRGILKAFAEVGIWPDEVMALSDDQLQACVDCACCYQDDSDTNTLAGARFAVEAFLEGDLDDCEV